VGGSADPRSAAKEREYGLDLSAHRAQQITAQNCNNWDWFVAMDAENRRATHGCTGGTIVDDAAV